MRASSACSEGAAVRIPLLLFIVLTLALPAPAVAATPLHAMLPRSVRQAGVLTIGSDISHPPVEFRNAATGAVEGMDADLARAMGRKLGVRVRFVDVPFDDLIPELQAQHFDAIMSAMRDTPERRRNVAFIDYFLTWTSILVRGGNPERIHDLTDLCGKTVDMERRIGQRGVILRASMVCITQHRGAIEVLTVANDANALALLKSGRSVAHIADFPVAAHDARESRGLFEVVGRRFGIEAYGIGVRKDETPLMRALQGALRAVIADGEYARILRTWRLSVGALTAANVEGGARTR